MNSSALLNILGTIVETIVPFITKISKFFVDNILWMSPLLIGAVAAITCTFLFVPFFKKLRYKRKFRNAAFDCIVIKNKIKKLERSNKQNKEIKIERLKDKLIRQQNKANIAQKKLSKNFYKKKVDQDKLISNNNQKYTENYSNILGFVDDRNRISVSSPYIKNVYVGALKRTNVSSIRTLKSNHKLSVTYNMGQNPELAFASDKKVLKETEFAILLGVKEKAEEMEAKGMTGSIVSKNNPLIIEHDRKVKKITNLNALKRYMNENFNLKIQKNVYNSINPISTNSKNSGRSM